jgi:hypothetical protein
MAFDPVTGAYILPQEAIDQFWQGWTPNYQTSSSFSGYPTTPSTSTTQPWVEPMSAWQQSQSDLANQQFAWQKQQALLAQQQAAAQNKPQQQQPNYSLQIAQMEQQMRQQELAAQQAWQQQQLAWYQQEQAAQLAAEKEQRLATLAAQPKSWLEYAALAGQAPVVQPWMKPLMPSDYQNVGVGEQIPGWNTAQNTAQSGGGLNPDWNMMGMPDLISPSAQYLARMGPTARDQYYGYQQADTGATPEETAWRRWSQAPPGASSYSLRQQR